MERWQRLEAADRRATLAGLFDRLDARELAVVRHCVSHAGRRPLRFIALWVNRLSNGILYPIVALVVLALCGRAAAVPLAVAGVSVIAAHAIYPVVKRRCARRRPFECDATIVSLLAPLDRHSFPSGHVMTATAAFVPLAAAMPQLTPLATAGIASIGWARMVAGHHYPSDLLAGAMLGGALVAPGLWFLS